MKVTAHMADEQRFEAGNWWASKPEYVLYALRSQLKAASAVWPELEGCIITCSPDPTSPTTSPTTMANAPWSNVGVSETGGGDADVHTGGQSTPQTGTS